VKIAIVGLPNAGKSTLFNALTQAGAQTADYPFTTIDPNVAVVSVPDERLEPIAATIGSSKIVHERISFHDIAGLVRGASAGEGLGNRFLAAIRETDAICQVVRCHGASGVPHPERRIDPLDDVAIVETELLAADLEQAEGRLERVGKGARASTQEAIAERDWLEAVVDALGAGRSAREVPPPAAAAEAPRLLSALTSKPALYVANVAEGIDEPPPELVEQAARVGARVVAISALVESELAELDDESEAAELRAGLGISETGLERLVRAAFDLLDLIVFFTADRDREAMARSLPRGATAWDAAGAVHTELQDAFVSAEVIQWSDLVEAGGYSAARERGTLRIAGRDYVVAEGDVIHIRT
jgi:ribosome-binding ATPase